MLYKVSIADTKRHQNPFDIDSAVKYQTGPRLFRYETSILYKISSRFWDNGDAVYLWYDPQKCVVISKSCESQTLDAVDSIVV